MRLGAIAACSLQVPATNALMQIDWPQTFTNDSNRKKLLIVTTCWPWPERKRKWLAAGSKGGQLENAVLLA